MKKFSLKVEREVEMLRDAKEKTRRFIADCHLGKTAKYLRLLGFDTLYFRQIDDDALIVLALKEKRMILTRDRELSERSTAACYYLEAVAVDAQLRELLGGLGLKAECRPFSRCLRCNTLLQPIGKEAAAQRVAPKVARYFDRFDFCPVCDKVFWHGDHYRRMQAYVERLLANET
jgi:hypothetical protein